MHSVTTCCRNSHDAAGCMKTQLAVTQAKECSDDVMCGAAAFTFMSSWTLATQSGAGAAILPTDDATAALPLHIGIQSGRNRKPVRSRSPAVDARQQEINPMLELLLNLLGDAKSTLHGDRCVHKSMG